MMRSLGYHEEWKARSEEWPLRGDWEPSISELMLLRFPERELSLILKEDVLPGDNRVSLDYLLPEVLSPAN
jgi:hypothetical protein